MRIMWMLALPAIAGCASATATRSRDYDAMLGELGRPAPARELAFGDHLDRAAVIRAVLAGNPGLDAARAAYRAAVADVATAGTFEDPRLSYELAPLSIAGSAPFGQRVQLSQKLPFPGKRGLAGDAAVADAAVAREDLRGLQLDLAALASAAFDAYTLAEQAIDVAEHHHAVIEQMKQASQAQLAAGRGSTQDALAAEVELGRIGQEHLMVEAERARVVARLNGLLHRDPEAPLPPPRVEELSTAPPPSLAELVRIAAERPDAAAATERLHGREAQLALADRASYPDLELMGSYDSMWDMPEHRWMLGIAIDLPLQRGKRAAAEDAARLRTVQATAEVERVRSDIRVDVFRARRDVEESLALVALNETRIVPAAQAQVEAALAGFVTGRNDFSVVLAAERGQRELQLTALRARAELSRRRATLDRAVGRLPGGGAP